MQTIIDTHQHLWDLDRFRLPWLKAGHPLAKNFLPADYDAAAKGTGIEQAIYMEVDVEAAQQQAEADYVVDLCTQGKTAMCAAVVGGRPESEDFPKYAAQFKGSKYVKGIRRALHGGDTPPGLCLRHTFIDNVRLLGELGLRFDLCMRMPELEDAAKLVTECPDTQFVLDHCGNPGLAMPAEAMEKWRRGVGEIAKRKNVVCKVSGFVANAKNREEATPERVAAIVNTVYEQFGAERVMFGGDWPVVTKTMSLADWVSLLKTVVKERTAEEQRLLFHDNAARFYKIER